MPLGGLAKRIFLWFSGIGGAVVVPIAPVGDTTVRSLTNRTVASATLARTVSPMTARTVSSLTLDRRVVAITRRTVS